MRRTGYFFFSSLLTIGNIAKNWLFFLFEFVDNWQHCEEQLSYYFLIHNRKTMFYSAIFRIDVKCLNRAESGTHSLHTLVMRLNFPKA